MLWFVDLTYDQSIQPFFCKWKLSMWTLIHFVLYNVLLTSESMGGILYCDNFNESYWAESSRGAV